MPVFKTRNWKTVELSEGSLADFAAMGGLEIDVLSSDCDVKVKRLDKKRSSAGDENTTEPAKKKNKKKQKIAATVSETQDQATIPAESEPAAVPVDMSKWDEFSLHPVLVSGLTSLRFTNPSPIQAAVLKQAMSGMDILGAAQTGSGKTLAFGLPILHSILSSSESDRKTLALCILPTRELAMQVRQHMKEVICGSSSSFVYVEAVIGGMCVQKQKRIMAQKPHIVVGTPGRLAGMLGLISRETEATLEQRDNEFKQQLADNLKFLVLDEADRLLEEAHFRDLTTILKFLYSATTGVVANSLTEKRTIQSFIFSATLGEVTGKLMAKLRLQPVTNRHIVDLTTSRESTNPAAASSLVSKNSVPSELKFRTLFPTTETDREPFLVYYLHKMLTNLLTPQSRRIIVFVNAISYVYRLAAILPFCFEDSVKVVGIHSKMKQKDRLKKLDQFKAAPVSIMVATDLAARGLDLPNVDAVVHLQAPRTPESLVHRSGRTARAGRTGECAMIIIPKQVAEWNKATKAGIQLEVDKIPAMSISSKDLQYVRDLHRMANTIESKTHTFKRETKDKAWTKRMCEEADIYNSEFDSSNDDNNSDDFDKSDYSNNQPTTVASKEQVEDLQSIVKAKLPSLRN